jgi:hypothetical protein
MLHKKNKYTGQRPILRQYYLFKEALEEKYLEIDEYKISVDHPNSKCYYGDEEYGVIYPKSWLKLFEGTEKSIDYFFSGYLNKEKEENRLWVLDYKNQNSIINFSDRGRNIPRDLFDIDFFDIMKKSKFSLCPQGYPYKWTYRFYEAILCKSIPILKEDDVIDDYFNYEFYIHNDEFDYDYSLDIINRNYNKALKRLFL